MDGLEAAVRLLAYQLWESAGCPSGRDREFWFSAEEELRRSRAEPAAVVVLVGTDALLQRINKEPAGPDSEEAERGALG